MLALRSLRRSCGLTLVEVAQQSELPARIIAEIEHGMRPFERNYRTALAHSYGVDPFDLCVEPALSKTVVTLLPHKLQPRRYLVGLALLSTLAGFFVCNGDGCPSSHVLAQPLSSGERRFDRSQTAQLVPVSEASDTSDKQDALPPLPGEAAETVVAASTSSIQPPDPPVPTATPEPVPTATPPPDSSVLMSLPSGGAFHQNVMAALTANGGALQQVIIPPGGTWSFNRAVGDPNLLDLTAIYGVYGGGWCDLASYYVTLLRPLLPPESFHFARHIDTTGFGLAGIPDTDAVAIWNTNGAGGEQDLVIHNTRPEPIHMRVTFVDGGSAVPGYRTT